MGNYFGQRFNISSCNLVEITMEKQNHPGLKVQHKYWAEMEHHVQQCFPEEACGLVAGNSFITAAIFPVTNQLHSHVRFYMDPLELLNTLKIIDENHWDLQAIFHSHPTGPIFPSPIDLNEHLYPEALALIWSPAQKKATKFFWQCRAYQMIGKSYLSVDIQLIPNM